MYNSFTVKLGCLFCFSSNLSFTLSLHNGRADGVFDPGHSIKPSPYRQGAKPINIRRQLSACRRAKFVMPKKSVSSYKGVCYGVSFRAGNDLRYINIVNYDLKIIKSFHS